MESEDEKTSTFVGSLLHEVQELWCKGMKPEEAAQYFVDTMNKNKEIFMEEKDFNTELRNGTNAIVDWFNRYGDDFETKFDLIGTEVLLEARIDDILFTGSIDRIYRDRETKEIIVFDTKTTRQGAERMFKSVMLGNQMTGYSFLVQENKISTGSPAICIDILELKKDAQAIRFPYQYITPERTMEFIYETLSTAHSIERSLRGLDLNKDALKLNVSSISDEEMTDYSFPRNCESCAMYGCPYEEICHTKITSTSEVKYPGFLYKDSGKKVLTVVSKLTTLS